MSDDCFIKNKKNRRVRKRIWDTTGRKILKIRQSLEVIGDGSWNGLKRISVVNKKELKWNWDQARQGLHISYKDL